MSETEEELDNAKLSDAERKEKREEYLKLMSQLVELKENTSTGVKSTRVVFHALKESAKLQEKVYDPQIISLDASLCSLSSDVLRRNVEAVNINAEQFKPEEFADAILKHIGDEQRDTRKWKPLLEFVNQAFNVSHTPFFMCNNINLSEEVVRPRVIRRRNVSENEYLVTRPENVTTVEKEEEGIEESVEHIMGIIISEWRKNKKKPICLFSLVINPDSFSTTVENIFHFSFLVRDQMVDVIIDGNGDPCVVPSLQQSANKRNANSNERSQKIFSINMQQWKEIKEQYNIKTPMITPISR